MSHLNLLLSQAALKNRELLSTLSQTDYAPPALKQNIKRICDLTMQISATLGELDKLHQITEDERKDHVKYRDSIVKRFVHGLGGQKGKEKFASRQEKEEREFLDAWQKEQEVLERRRELDGLKQYARHKHIVLEADNARHVQAQSELDELYQSLFSGPTPEVPGEDRLEEAVVSAKERYELCSAQYGKDYHAMEALRQAHQALGTARSSLADALNPATKQKHFGGSFTEVMEKHSLSGMETSLSLGLRHIEEAHRKQPAINQFVGVDQGVTRNIMLSDISGKATQDDRIKGLETYLKQILEHFDAEVVKQEQRATEMEVEEQDSSRDLDEARQALQRIRAQAFGRVVGGGDDEPPPAYSSEQCTAF